MPGLFARAAVMTLVVGLIAIGVIVAFSNTPIFSPSAPVDSEDKAKTLFEQYASSQRARINAKPWLLRVACLY